jgi:stage III sporulation protein SpoIIIAA
MLGCVIISPEDGNNTFLRDVGRTVPDSWRQLLEDRNFIWFKNKSIQETVQCH